MKPWSTYHLEGRITMPKRHNDENYNGLNILLLWDALMSNSYTKNQWMTFKQAKELGGHILKGQRGHQVIYANTMVKTEQDPEGKELSQTIPFLKMYTVFNVEQIKGLPEEYYNHHKDQASETGICLNDRLESFFTSTGAIIQHGGNKAYYNQSRDYIRMPRVVCFKDVESYYATPGPGTR
jgi:antirestriction protein ArdC